MANSAVLNQSLLTQDDIIKFQQGIHYELYTKMGSKTGKMNGQQGMYFTVWAPHAARLSVIGEFNNWQHDRHDLFLRDDGSGIWQGFIEGCVPGQMYKYHIHSNDGIEMDKGDPFAHEWEVRPLTASLTSNLDYNWKDAQWMQQQKNSNALNAPWSVYEVHLLSWMRPDRHDQKAVNTYAQAIELLVPYVKSMGFTHVELMPIMEHPNDASWGYQGTGFFAPTSRFGGPLDFMQLIDAFHQAGIGVILDWVPSHFPYDAHGLYMYDGTHQYEYEDMRKGYHPDWHSYIFNYGKGEVKSFLTSSARFWVDVFHADGLRVDGVSSMLILSYSRSESQWEPNELGGDSNLEAIKFLQDLNDHIAMDFPGVQVIAEESTAWKAVTGPAKEGGLGFGMKWMMGWMHDTLEYFQTDPKERKARLDKFRMSMNYFYDECFMLALSHDEVVYGKKPMLGKMPGNEQEKFANLRLLYTYMFTHPGGKLLFMGDEFGSDQEWNFKSELPWEILQRQKHRMLKDCVRDLCYLLRKEPALYEKQFDKSGFEWIDGSDTENAVVFYKRKGKSRENDLLIALNLDPDTQKNCRVTVTGKQKWSVIFNSDALEYGGNSGTIVTRYNEASNSISFDLPGLTALVLK